MVRLSIVKASNASIRKHLSPGFVAVFVGGTSGIGEATLKLLAKRAVKPRIYIVGRSADSGAKIVAECNALNSDGEFIFIQKDLTLLKAAADLCEEIKAKERFINLLFLSVGLPDFSLESECPGLLSMLHAD